MRKRDWGYTVIIAIISGLIIFWLAPKPGREISRSAIEVANTATADTIELRGQKGASILEQLKQKHRVTIKNNQIWQIDNLACSTQPCWQLSVNNQPVTNAWLNVDSAQYSAIKLHYEANPNQ